MATCTGFQNFRSFESQCLINFSFEKKVAKKSTYLPYRIVCGAYGREGGVEIILLRQGQNKHNGHQEAVT